MALGASPKASAERRARMIVLSLINHPQLLHELWPDFSNAELLSSELDSLRTEILDSASSQEQVETLQLRSHLLQRGYGPVLDRLEAQAKSLNEWHLSPAAAQDDARTGLRQMIALHHKAITLDRELKAAEAALASEMTEENQSVVWALQDQLASLEGNEATIEGFGAASGRGSDPVG